MNEILKVLQSIRVIPVTCSLTIEKFVPHQDPLGWMLLLA